MAAIADAVLAGKWNFRAMSGRMNSLRWTLQQMCLQNLNRQQDLPQRILLQNLPQWIPSLQNLLQWILPQQNLPQWILPQQNLPQWILPLQNLPQWILSLQNLPQWILSLQNLPQWCSP
ncbi:MAG: hypothetical protein ACNYPE_03120 [Candidatus Azotimanducaceae bacterium WSBS_2022_MAG_OTU7]